MKIFNLVLIIFILSFTTKSFAAPLRIVSGEFAPYSGEHIPNQGVSTVLVNTIFKELKQDITIEFMPWKRAMNNLLNMSAAGSYPWSKNSEREKTVLFSNPINQTKMLFYVRKGNQFKTKESLAKAHICQPQGWDTSHINKLISDHKMFITRPMDIDSCFRMLAINRVDLVIINSAVGNEIIKKLFGEMTPVEGVPSTFYQQVSTLHFIVPKNYPNADKIIKNFNLVLEKMRKSGEYDAIMSLDKSYRKMKREKTIATCESCNPKASS